VASSLNYAEISDQVQASGVDICVTRDEIYDVISCCDAIASCSGTVTLEIALLGVPMCVVYKVSSLSYLIMSRLITIPHISLVNIVARTPVVQEFLQAAANPETVSGELFRLLDDPEYRLRLRAGFDLVRDNLGTGNGAQNMAELVLSLVAKQPLEQQV
jgi:lipid-A-disaccharide synthase